MMSAKQIGGVLLRPPFDPDVGTSIRIAAALGFFEAIIGVAIGAGLWFLAVAITKRFRNQSKNI